jgi:hypothetical protein
MFGYARDVYAMHCSSQDLGTGMLTLVSIAGLHFSEFLSLKTVPSLERLIRRCGRGLPYLCDGKGNLWKARFF